jgi:prepilin-type N-terminal cleavage/methylation domain-containing protein
MNKAFSLVEILVSIAVMGIIALSMANFSSNVFNISYKNTEALTVVNQTRDLSAFISNEINRAEYIFPSGIELALSANSSTATVNTTNSIAFLVNEDNSSSIKKYFLKVFYIVDGNIFFFTSTESVTWPTNTMPTAYFSKSTGNAGLVLSNVGSSTLSYVVNSSNGITDPVLKGTIGGASQNSSNALIKGVSWTISVQDKDYYLGGISQNVPR